MNGREKAPQEVKGPNLEKDYAIANFEDLEENEKRAVIDAAIAYSESKNTDFKAGACALAEDNTRFSSSNNAIGREGHAEQQALIGLYEKVKPSHKKLKALALVASRPGESAVRDYGKQHRPEGFEDTDWEGMCGHCRKFIYDYTAGNTEDVAILIMATTGQIMRTSLQKLYPHPHRVTRVPLAPIRHPAAKKLTAEELAKLPDEIKRLRPPNFFDDPSKGPHESYSAPK